MGQGAYVTIGKKEYLVDLAEFLVGFSSNHTYVEEMLQYGRSLGLFEMTPTLFDIWIRETELLL